MFNYKEQRYFKVALTLHTGKGQAESIIKNLLCTYCLMIFVLIHLAIKISTVIISGRLIWIFLMVDADIFVSRVATC